MMPDLISTQDHDLLIQLHTKMDTVIVALESIRQLENQATRHSEKIKAIEADDRDANARIEKRIEKLENKSTFLDMISFLWAAGIGALVYFFGKH